MPNQIAFTDPFKLTLPKRGCRKMCCHVTSARRRSRQTPQFFKLLKIGIGPGPRARKRLRDRVIRLFGGDPRERSNERDAAQLS